MLQTYARESRAKNRELKTDREDHEINANKIIAKYVRRLRYDGVSLLCDHEIQINADEVIASSSGGEILMRIIHCSKQLGDHSE